MWNSKTIIFVALTVIAVAGILYGLRVWPEDEAREAGRKIHETVQFAQEIHDRTLAILGNPTIRDSKSEQTGPWYEPDNDLDDIADEELGKRLAVLPTATINPKVLRELRTSESRLADVITGAGSKASDADKVLAYLMLGRVQALQGRVHMAYAGFGHMKMHRRLEAVQRIMPEVEWITDRIAHNEGIVGNRPTELQGYLTQAEKDRDALTAQIAAAKAKIQKLEAEHKALVDKAAALRVQAAKEHAQGKVEPGEKGLALVESATAKDIAAGQAVVGAKARRQQIDYTQNDLKMLGILLKNAEKRRKDAEDQLSDRKQQDAKQRNEIERLQKKRADYSSHVKELLTKMKDRLRSGTGVDEAVTGKNGLVIEPREEWIGIVRAERDARDILRVAMGNLEDAEKLKPEYPHTMEAIGRTHFIKGALIAEGVLVVEHSGKVAAHVRKLWPDDRTIADLLGDIQTYLGEPELSVPTGEVADAPATQPAEEQLLKADPNTLRRDAADAFKRAAKSFGTARGGVEPRLKWPYDVLEAQAWEMRCRMLSGIQSDEPSEDPATEVKEAAASGLEAVNRALEGGRKDSAYLKPALALKKTLERY